MAKLKSRIINIRQAINHQDYNWTTYYKGDVVKKVHEKIILDLGGELYDDAPVVEEKPVVIEKEEEPDVDKMNKDEIEELVKNKWGIDLDKRKSLRYLRSEYKRLNKGEK